MWQLVYRVYYTRYEFHGNTQNTTKDIVSLIVGTIFYLKEKILIFWTKIRQKEASSYKKVNITIKLSIFELEYAEYTRFHFKYMILIFLDQIFPRRVFPVRWSGIGTWRVNLSTLISHSDNKREVEGYDQLVDLKSLHPMYSNFTRLCSKRSCVMQPLLHTSFIQKPFFF